MDYDVCWQHATESTDGVSPLEVVSEPLYQAWRPRQVVDSNDEVEEDRKGTAVVVVVVVVAVHSNTEVDTDTDILHWAVDTLEVVEEDSHLAAVAARKLAAVHLAAVAVRKIVVAAVHTVDNTCRWAPSVKVEEGEEDCWKQCVLLLVWKQLVARCSRHPNRLLLRHHSNTLVDSARCIPIHHPYPTDRPRLMFGLVAVAVVAAAALAITVAAVAVVLAFVVDVVA
jgi:hypothetical protein